MIGSRRITGLYGHAVFAVLAAWALYCWQARTLILDAAFQSFQFIAEGRPVVMVERFGAALIQIFPLVFVKADAPLSMVLQAWSAAFVLYHWGLFAIAFHGLKDNKTAIAIAWFALLFTGDCFYWIQNELLPGIALLLLGIGYLREYSFKRTWHWVVLAALMFTLVYIHPLMIFPLGYVALRNDARLDKRVMLGAGAFALLAFAAKYLLQKPNFYDRGMTGQYVREFHFSLSAFLQSRSLHDFIAHLSRNFLLLLPLLLLLSWFYAQQRRFLRLIWLWLAVTGYTFILMQRFLQDDRWYIQESHYQVLALFILVPLVWELIPEVRWRPWLTGLVLLLTLWRLGGIFALHEQYAERLQYVRALMQGRTQTLSVIDEAKLDRKKLLMTWGLPYETLQISALESPEAVRIIAVAENADSLSKVLPQDSMTTFLMFPRKAFKDLPQQYYRISPGEGWKQY